MELSTKQRRVIQTLGRIKGRGAITRARISDLGGGNQTAVSWAIGYSSPERRVEFENTKDGGFRPSLLSLGLVEEVKLDVDGIVELGVRLTSKGREAYELVKDEVFKELTYKKR